MQAKIARHSVGAIFFLLALALLPHFIGPDPAMAFSAYGTTFATVYPSSTTRTNAGCNLCHSAGGGTDLNAYGEAWAVERNKPTVGPTAAAFTAIESLNSDNDPTRANNLAEINANAQPGWTPGPNNTFYNVAAAGTGTVAQ
jgi:hypothetical protein